MVRVLSVLFFALLLPAELASAQARIDLDRVVESIARSGPPRASGQRAVRAHASYPRLKGIADALSTRIEWVDHVARRVLRFPPVPERLKVTERDELDGWFDEYTRPNLIILHRDVGIATLVHEIRHAIHLGSHGLTAGSRVDRAIQRARQGAREFRGRLAAAPLRAREKARLSQLSIRVVESASEILAHGDELTLARAWKDGGMEAGSLRLQREYREEFRRAYRELREERISRDEAFLKALAIQELQQ